MIVILHKLKYVYIKINSNEKIGVLIVQYALWNMIISLSL